MKDVLTKAQCDLCTLYNAKELISSKPKGGMKPQQHSWDCGFCLTAFLDALSKAKHNLCTIHDAKELISSKPKRGMKPQNHFAAPIHRLPHLQHSAAPRRCCCGYGCC